MKLSNGRPYLAIPGPSVVPDQVLQAMQRVVPDIYDQSLQELTAALVPDLRQVARTEGDVAMYIANGHGVWEAALSNVVSAGESLLCVANGLFGSSWGSMAQGLEIDVEMLNLGTHASTDLEKFSAKLAGNCRHRFKAVLVTHVDTSSSHLNNIADIRAKLNR